MADTWRLLVFGASGAIGETVAQHARARGWAVVGATRGAVPADAPNGIEWRRYDPLRDDAATVMDGEMLSDRASCLFVVKSAAELVP